MLEVVKRTVGKMEVRVFYSGTESKVRTVKILEALQVVEDELNNELETECKPISPVKELTPTVGGVMFNQERGE